MKVSIIQQDIIWGDKNHNLNTFGSTIESLYGSTELVILPEMFSTGFSVDKPELAESTDGDAIQAIKR